MLSSSSRFACGVLFTTFAIVACSTASSTPDLSLTEVDASPTEPPIVLPPSQSFDAAVDASPGDAGKDAAKGKDAAVEAGPVDAGAPAPAEGAACATADEIFTRQCGACGSQQAICIENVVSEYSPCINELKNGCVPGTVTTEACGNCGTVTKTCSATCDWIAPVCNEPVNSCAPTSHDFTAAGCLAGTYRTRDCDDACQWSNFTLSCDPLDFQIVASGTAATSVSGIFPLRANVTTTRLSGTCPNASLGAASGHAYAYVKVVNPTEQTLKLTAWNASAGVIVDTLMAYYPTKPTNDAERKACGKGVIESCPTAACGDYRFAGLGTVNAFTIAPFESGYVFFQSAYAIGAAAGTAQTEGSVKLVVQTETVQ